MKLLLYSWIIEELRNTIFIRAATGFSFYLIVKFLIKGTIPKGFSWLSISVAFGSIANTNAVIWIYSFSCLYNTLNTSSASLFPVKHEGLVSSAEVYLQFLIRFLISGP
jgi:hypothetical protein